MQSTVEQINQTTSEIIKSTIPLLEEHGMTLVERMYEYLLINYPEYESFFNKAHLGGGDGKQITALTSFLLFYAKNFDTPSVLLPALEKANQIHVAKRILPEYYPPVGEAIQYALQEQFDLPDGHEILIAWGDAYSFLSELMIQLETDIQDQAKQQEYGWEGYRKVSVLEVIEETADTIRIWLGTSDNEPLVEASPLQFITLSIPELEMSREFSVVASKRNFYEIAVKKKGKVSQYLHNRVKPGSELFVSMPFGGVKTKLANLKENVLVFSGGIGVTAHLSLLREFRESLSERQVFHFHSVKNRAEHCFFNDLALLDECINIHNINIYSNPSETDKCGEHFQLDGYIDKSIFEALRINPSTTSCFVCGPTEYMVRVKEILKFYGVEKADIHYEHFGPTANLD